MMTDWMKYEGRVVRVVLRDDFKYRGKVVGVVEGSSGVFLDVFDYVSSGVVRVNVGDVKRIYVDEKEELAGEEVEG